MNRWRGQLQVSPVVQTSNPRQGWNQAHKGLYGPWLFSCSSVATRSLHRCVYVQQCRLVMGVKLEACRWTDGELVEHKSSGAGQ